MNKYIKRLAVFATALFAAVAFPCEPVHTPTAYYHDYISGINNYQVVSTVSTSKSTDLNTTYNITNNQIVDLPITVYLKMTSNVWLLDTVKKNQVITSKLQYRILPDGSWVDVKTVVKSYGTIPITTIPQAYFGRNNIWPKGLSRGTAIMIRYYTTDGSWQSGILSNMCTLQLANRSISGIGTVYTLPSSFSYTYSESYDDQILGGNWAPPNCITVIYSGHERPPK